MFQFHIEDCLYDINRKFSRSEAIKLVIVSLVGTYEAEALARPS